LFDQEREAGTKHHKNMTQNGRLVIVAVPWHGRWPMHTHRSTDDLHQSIPPKSQQQWVVGVTVCTTTTTTAVKEGLPIQLQIDGDTCVACETSCGSILTSQTKILILALPIAINM
jgi:hypothetical protein